MEDRPRVCELCSGAPDLYCNSDDAFLCFDCDSRVHHANFVVSRHLRLLICHKCRSLTHNSLFGPRSLSHSAACASCSSSEPESVPDQNMDSTSCCSSSNLSSTTQSGSSTAKVIFSNYQQRGDSGSAKDDMMDQQRPRNTLRFAAQPVVCEGKIGTIFANWCQKLGINGDLVESKAIQAMGLCSRGLGTTLSFRLSLAASFWFGIRPSKDKLTATRQNLRRLAHVSGVPAELIVSVDAKLERELKGSGRSWRRSEPQEGWAESVV